jgi:predicted kinase
VFIILSGLPGTGKTTLGRELARQLGAVYVRIDTIECAIASAEDVPLGEAGYRVGYAVAEDNLRLGRTVVADSVNPLRVTRDAWRDVAVRAGVIFVEVLVVCSDPIEHRRRVETRTTDIVGFTLPTWQDVLRREFEPWRRDHVVIDTAAQTVEQSMAALRAALPAYRQS